MTDSRSEGMHKGYATVWRKIWDNPRSSDPEWVSVWVYLITNATWKGLDAVWQGKRITLKPGQLITGRKAISRATGVNESKVFRLLKCFKNEHQIEQQTSNVSSLISITNWECYQRKEHRIEQQMNNQRTASEQPVNTNNNVKKVKHEKHVQELLCSEPETASEPIMEFPVNPKKDPNWIFTAAYRDELQELFPHIDITTEARKALAWVKANPSRRKTRNGMKKFINGWIGRANDRGSYSNPNQQQPPPSKPKEPFNWPDFRDTLQGFDGYEQVPEDYKLGWMNIPSDWAHEYKRRKAEQ